MSHAGPISGIFDRQMCRRVLIPQWSASSGKACIYATGFTEAAPGVTVPVDVDFYWGSRNPDVTLQIVRTATSGGLIETWVRHRGQYWQTDYSCKHQIHNTTTARIRVIGYRCKQRTNVPRNTEVDYFASTNIWRHPTFILGNGFFSNSIGSTNGTGNQGLNLPQFTPFESYDFCKAYKILEVKGKTIEPGRKATFTLSDKRILHMIPELLQPFADNAQQWQDIQTMNASNVSFEHIGGEQFWLFKLMADTVGEVESAVTNLVTMPEMEAMITTEFRCEGKLAYNQISNSEHGRAIAAGFTTPGGFAVEVINPETEEKNQVEEL